MNYILYDSNVRTALLPFTYTRPVADLRVGILTIREKWEKRLGLTTTTLTESYLGKKYPMIEMEQNIMINASFIPTDALVDMVQGLKENEAVVYRDDIVAFFATDTQEVDTFDAYELINYNGELVQIGQNWDLFTHNAKAIEDDFKFLTEGRKSAEIPSSIHCFNKEAIFVEEGVELTTGSLNATNGPIYIGKDAVVLEACAIRGPFAMCEGAILKMGAKIYSGTTIGPKCKVGGEVNNVIFFANSNKSHDGYLGNSVIGEWCNIGADTNSSNLKNNYAEVRAWSYETKGFARTGLQFCGLMMGDHSKCGINTMFNTGTVVGVSANVFGSGFPRSFIPSFSWGGSSGFSVFQMSKVKETATVMMERKGSKFDELEAAILEEVFEQSKEFRRFG